MNKQLMSKIFKKAHALAKSIRTAGDSYRDTFALCLKFVRARGTAEIVADMLNGLAKFAEHFLAKAWVSPDKKVVRVYITETSCRKPVDHGYLELHWLGWSTMYAGRKSSVNRMLGRYLREMGLEVAKA